MIRCTDIHLTLISGCGSETDLYKETFHSTGVDSLAAPLVNCFLSFHPVAVGKALFEFSGSEVTREDRRRLARMAIKPVALMMVTEQTESSDETPSGYKPHRSSSR
jgi:hypothetical protein